MSSLIVRRSNHRPAIGKPIARAYVLHRDAGVDHGDDAAVGPDVDHSAPQPCSGRAPRDQAYSGGATGLSSRTIRRGDALRALRRRCNTADPLPRLSAPSQQPMNDAVRTAETMAPARSRPSGCFLTRSTTDRCSRVRHRASRESNGPWISAGSRVAMRGGSVQRPATRRCRRSRWT